MHLILPLLAQLENEQDRAIREAAQRHTSPWWSTDTSLILAAGLALAAVFFFWAFFLRKRPETHRGSMVLERAKRESPERYGSSGRRRRRKRRPDHPENLPRNPTLAEIGGLPPPRPEEPEPPTGDGPAQSPELQR
jgi:hypothetical protein